MDVEFRLRRAHAGDSRRATEIAHISKGHWGYPKQWLESWRDELRLLPEYLDRHHAVVAECGGTVQAAGVLESHENAARLEHVWVHPRVQGLGIGRAIVQTLLDEARRLGHPTVDVMSDPNAEAFYQRLGAFHVEDVPAAMPGHRERTLPKMRFRLTS